MEDGASSRGITKGCTRSTHSGGCEVVRLLFVPGEPRRYHACLKQLNNNPYNSPSESGAASSPNKSPALSDESKANLRFGANIAKALSIGCVLAAFYTCYATIRGINDLNEIYGNWTWLHYLTIVRSFYLPVLLAFSWITWRLGSSMFEIANIGSSLMDAEWDKHASNATWLCIGLSLFAAVSLLEIAARYSMLYYDGT